MAFCCPLPPSKYHHHHIFPPGDRLPGELDGVLLKKSDNFREVVKGCKQQYQAAVFLTIMSQRATIEVVFLWEYSRPIPMLIGAQI